MDGDGPAGVVEGDADGAEDFADVEPDGLAGDGEAGGEGVVAHDDVRDGALVLEEDGDEAEEEREEKEGSGAKNVAGGDAAALPPDEEQQQEGEHDDGGFGE